MESQERDLEGDHDSVGAVNYSLAHDYLVGKERRGEAVDERAGSAIDKGDNAGGKVHQFYFVKHHPFENPSLVATEKIVQHRFIIEQKRKEKLMDRDGLYFSLRYRRYWDQQWGREDLKLLKLSTDKLCFANKVSLCKAIKPSSSVDEIDNLSLHFGMLHGGNNLADERRILKKISEAQRKADPCMSMQEFDQKIRRLHDTNPWQRPDSNEERKTRDEIKRLELAREEAMTSAACKGKMWDSLGSKLTIRKQVQLIEEGLDKTRQQHLAFNAELAFVKKELASVKNELKSVEKELLYIERMKGDAYKFILEWKKSIK
ncbi:uncharacterized protein LOC104443073 [Eucalyptus grandis]|uniref:uncharacterized protein LOC104443073 n=1 Tax=Eucalyptus grandis TaxID=71139 RepID=UPI00192ECC69|nr:uncharacterized protein LOC104443073 [Eucalyptus grandis]